VWQNDAPRKLKIFSIMEFERKHFFGIRKVRSLCKNKTAQKTTFIIREASNE